MMVNYDIATVGEFMFCTRPQISMERLFLQLIKKKLTSLGRFPPLNYHKTLNFPTILFPPLKFQKKISPPPTHSHVLFDIVLPTGSPYIYKGGRNEGKGGGGGGEKLCLCCRFIFSMLRKLNFYI